MASIADLLIRIGADISQLQQKLGQAGAEVEQFTQKVEATQQVATATAVAFAAAGAAILAGIGILVRQADAAQREVRLLENALRASGQAADPKPYQDLATELQRLTGMSDELILRVARTLIQFGATRAQVEALTPRILDYAAATGKDAVGAAELFGRAVSGMDSALTRTLGGLAQGIDLAGDFDGALRVLDQAFGGAARASRDTLGGALQGLREDLGNLAEILGGPLLKPLTDLINTAAAAVRGLKALAEAHPPLVQAVAVASVALAVFLLGTGGVIAIQLAVARLLPFLVSLATASAAVGSAATAGAAGVGTMAAATTGLNVALGLGLVGALMTVTLMLLQIPKVGAAVAATLTTLAGVIIEFASGVAEIRGGLLAFDTTRIAAGVERVKNMFATAADAGRREYARMLEEASRGQKQLTDTGEEAAEKLALIEGRFATAGAAADLMAKQTEAAAAQQARLALQQPGLKEADIQAIEERRTRIVNEAAETRLQFRILAAERERAEIVRAGLGTAEKLRQIDDQIATSRTDLETKRLESAKQTATAVVAAEKAAAEQRIATERAVRDAQLSILQAGAQARLTVIRAETDAEEQARQQRLNAVRLEEELRVGMLRRIGEIERTLASAIVEGRTALLRAQFSREEALARVQAVRRAELVRQGALTEADAAEQAAKETLARKQRQLQAEFELEQQRQQQAQLQLQISVGLAQAEADAKLRVLQAETDARRASFVAQQQLKEIDLRSTLEIERAKAQAAIDASQAELQAKLEALQQELAARRAAGVITPEAEASRRAQIQSVIAAAQAFQQGQARVIGIQQEAVQRQLVIGQQATNNALAAMDQELAAKRLQIQQELNAQLIALQSGDVRAKADATARLAQLEAALTDATLEERQRLTAQGFSEAEIQQRLAPVLALQNQIKSLLTQQATGIDQQLTTLETAYKAFADRVKAMLQPVADLVKSLANPATLRNLLPQPSALTPALATAGAIPTGPSMAIFQFQNVEMRLTADEQTILTRLLEKLLGPEGNRLVQDQLRRIPGPRGPVP